MKAVMPSVAASTKVDMCFAQISTNDGQNTYTYLVPSDDAAVKVIEDAFADKGAFSGNSYIISPGVSRRSVIVPGITNALKASGKGENPAAD